MQFDKNNQIYFYSNDHIYYCDRKNQVKKIRISLFEQEYRDLANRHMWRDIYWKTFNRLNSRVKVFDEDKLEFFFSWIGDIRPIGKMPFWEIGLINGQVIKCSEKSQFLTQYMEWKNINKLTIGETIVTNGVNELSRRKKSALKKEYLRAYKKYRRSNYQKAPNYVAIESINFIGDLPAYSITMDYDYDNIVINKFLTKTNSNLTNPRDIWGKEDVT